MGAGTFMDLNGNVLYHFIQSLHKLFPLIRRERLVTWAGAELFS